MARAVTDYCAFAVTVDEMVGALDKYYEHDVESWTNLEINALARLYAMAKNFVSDYEYRKAIK